jgi:hypothetical protein
MINPVEYVDTSPDSLQEDYKTDYVLMVAEAYQGDGELPLAVRRLAALGETPPVETVYQAILFAQKIGYLDADIEKMQVLMNAMQSSEFNLETSP